MVSGKSLVAEAQLKVLACVLIGGKGFVFFESSKEPKILFLFNLFEKAQTKLIPIPFSLSHQKGLPPLSFLFP